MDTRAAIERFLASPALADATRRAYKVDVEEFDQWLRACGTRLDKVDVEVLSAYAAELGRARRWRRGRSAVMLRST